MVFIFTEVVALALIAPGVGILVPGVVLLFLKKRRLALIFLLIAFLVLAGALTLLGWSLYEINVFCPAKPAECG